MKFIDQMNRSIFLDSTPKKIVSLVPSQTELLIELGLGKQLVGITKFCVHPIEITKNIKIIGGTKNFKIDEIKATNPDIIFANKEENDEIKLKELMHHIPVWISNITNLEDALKMIHAIGNITQTSTNAKTLINNIKNQFKLLASIPKKNKSVLYLIWNKPYMTINKNTFIHNMLEKCGLSNVSANFNDRYPTIEFKYIQALNPDLILLSSEPFPFKEIHQKELKKKLPNTDIKIVNGEFFSWYGSRLFKSTDYFINNIL